MGGLTSARLGLTRALWTPALCAQFACALSPPTGPNSRNSLAEQGAAGLRAIRAEAISARVRFLSDDLLEGRFTGSRGHAIAERYVAAELRALGVEPAAADGSYFQPVPLRAARTDVTGAALVLSNGGGVDEQLEVDVAFVPLPDFRSSTVDVSAPLAFGGFGVSAPEFRYDDLAGVDWKGKIALLLVGAPLSDRPDFFPPAPHAVYSKWLPKVCRLAARGAVGVLFAWTPDMEERFPWKQFVRESRLEEMAWLEGGVPAREPQGVPVRGALAAEAAARILSRAGVPGGYAGMIEEARTGTARARDLGLRVRFRATSVHRDFTGRNVVGLWRGADSELSRELVVFTAHLDHLGLGEPVKGDAVYNGAVDNASGVAGLLEVARAFAALPIRPGRSILFAAVTGEEVGYVGSDYLAHHPPLPGTAFAANVNLDMLLGLYPLHEVIALGDAHSALALPAREAAAALGVRLGPDPLPKLVRFVRSDQYSFVERGVPALFPIVGLRDASGNPDSNLALRKAWMAHYHQPTDEWRADLDYEAMAQLARFDFLVGLSVATRLERPRWNSGDFFERFPEPGAR